MFYFIDLNDRVLIIIIHYKILGYTFKTCNIKCIINNNNKKLCEYIRRVRSIL